MKTTSVIKATEMGYYKNSDCEITIRMKHRAPEGFKTERAMLEKYRMEDKIITLLMNDTVARNIKITK